MGFALAAGRGADAACLHSVLAAYAAGVAFGLRAAMIRRRKQSGAFGYSSATSLKDLKICCT